jgi:uncharacterized membrane protein
MTGTPRAKEGEVTDDIDNVVVVRFDEASKAREALNVVKQCASDGRIGLASAAVVKRTAAGEVQTIETWDDVGPAGAVSGAMLGVLIGILGGPVGMLIGWGAGAVVGGVFDIDRVETSDEALAAFGRAIPPESTALIANATEPAVEVIDVEMKKLGGEVTRRPVADVMDEMEAADEAARAAAKEARRVTRERHKAEITADLDKRVGTLKEKLHVA